jgi:hypothetical protein
MVGGRRSELIRLAPLDQESRVIASLADMRLLSDFADTCSEKDIERSESIAPVNGRSAESWTFYLWISNGEKY